MSNRANITSIDAVRQFLLTLQQFAARIDTALTDLRLESRRAVDWIENDRTRYWPQEVRKSSDALGQAFADLERCEMSISPDDRRPCYEQKKALKQAKQRVRTTEEKVRIVKSWRIKVNQATDEFESRLAVMAHYLESQIPRAVAALKRMSAALEKYTQPALPDDVSVDATSELNDENG